MNRPTLLAALILSLLSSVALAQIYQWKDENGKTIISDKPPTSATTQSRQVNTADAPASSAAHKSTADREMDFRKRLKEKQESADKTEKEQAAAEQVQNNCAAARRYLQTLESGERISMRDDKGERYFLDDAQRAQETVKARQALQANCSK